MPKKYVIYRNDNTFVFEQIIDGKTVAIGYREYRKTIERFIENGYTISYDGECIILKGKKRLGIDQVTITIMADEKIFACKYFKNLKRSMARVKKEKGYILITEDEKGNIHKNRVTNKKSHKSFDLVKFMQQHAATVGIAITIIATLTTCGLYSVRNAAKEKDNSLESDSYSISMADDIAPYYMDNNIIRPYSFTQSFLMNQEFLDSIFKNEDEKENEEVSVNKDEEYNKYLKTYAEYFHLDPNKVVEFAETATENYTLPFNEVIGMDYYDLNSKEAACMVFVHELNRNNLAVPLENYGLSTSYFVVDPTVTPLPSDKILSNGQTFEQFLGHVCDLLQIDKSWILGITYLETGRLTSDIALNKNNFGGLRGNDGFFTYISPEAGIIAHCRNLKRYEYFGLQSIYELAGKYVFGNSSLIYQVNENPSDPTLASYGDTMKTWVNSVTWFHDEFKNNAVQVFGESQVENEDNYKLELN